MPSGTDGTLVVTTDPTYAGVKLRADFSAATNKPIRVQFLRNGQPVRSGDWAWAPGGVAFAYDHEAPLGVASTWTAVPMFASTGFGAPTSGVTLTNDAMSADVDCWVKPCGNPSKAIALQVHIDQVEEGWTARSQVTQVQGRYPVASWDKRTPSNVSVTLRTTTKAQKDALAAALDEGTVIVQMNAVYGIDDFYAIPGDAKLNYFVGMFSPLRDVPVEFVPVDRPPTLDAPLLWPGRTWADITATSSTWADVANAYPTWADIFTLGLPTNPGGGSGGSGYGSATYGP